jgi:hypothetical protein
MESRLKLEDCCISDTCSYIVDIDEIRKRKITSKLPSLVRVLQSLQIT